MAWRLVRLGLAPIFLAACSPTWTEEVCTDRFCQAEDVDSIGYIQKAIHRRSALDPELLCNKRGKTAAVVVPSALSTTPTVSQVVELLRSGGVQVRFVNDFTQPTNTLRDSLAGMNNLGFLLFYPFSFTEADAEYMRRLAYSGTTVILSYLGDPADFGKSAKFFFGVESDGLVALGGGCSFKILPANRTRPLTKCLLRGVGEIDVGGDRNFPITEPTSKEKVSALFTNQRGGTLDLIRRFFVGKVILSAGFLYALITCDTSVLSASEKRFVLNIWTHAACF